MLISLCCNHRAKLKASISRCKHNQVCICFYSKHYTLVMSLSHKPAKTRKCYAYFLYNSLQVPYTADHSVPYKVQPLMFWHSWKHSSFEVLEEWRKFIFSVIAQQQIYSDRNWILPMSHSSSSSQSWVGFYNIPLKSHQIRKTGKEANWLITGATSTITPGYSTDLPLFLKSCHPSTCQSHLPLESKEEDMKWVDIFLNRSRTIFSV